MVQSGTVEHVFQTGNTLLDCQNFPRTRARNGSISKNRPRALSQFALDFFSNQGKIKWRGKRSFKNDCGGPLPCDVEANRFHGTRKNYVAKLQKVMRFQE